MMTSDTLAAVPVGERQLFLDDAGITHLERLTRTAHQPAKKGAVIRTDLDDVGQGSIQIRTAPAWDPTARVYKLWTITTPEALAAQGIRCAGYYESADGLHWSKPSRAGRVPRFAAEQLHRRPHQQGVSRPHACRLRRYRPESGAAL